MQSLAGGYILEQEKSLKKLCPFLSRGHEFYLYNGERTGMIDKGVTEICLFQSNGIKTFLSNHGMHRETCRSTNQQCTRGVQQVCGLR